MKPAPFEYIVPNSFEAVLPLVAQYGTDGKLLAGGQSLIPAMNFRLLQPTVLIDLNRVSSLAGIAPTTSGGVRMGAMTRQAAIERSKLIKERCPLLAEAILWVAHPQIRNRGTIGGSLVHADPAGELPVIAVAMEAKLELRSQRGSRWVAAESFFQSLFTVDLAADEVVVGVEMPALAPHTGWSFLEVARRAGDYALAGVAAILTLDPFGICQQARLVYLNVGDTPMVAHQAAKSLVGERITPDRIASAVQLATSQEIAPAGNIHASADFQGHLARVLSQRALTIAHQRAQER